MKKERSCGIILFRNERKEFLLMKHYHRYDLPKGHVELGESDIETAKREFWEETGIALDNIKINDEFRYEEVYYPEYYSDGEKIKTEKTLVIYLADLIKESEIILTEHIGYEWLKWSPPHNIQHYTIDPLLKQLQKFFEKYGK